MFNQSYSSSTAQLTTRELEGFAWVGLGGNLGDSVALFDHALQSLATLAQGPLLISARYHSPPWGRADQPVFLNQVAGLVPLDHLTPEGLLRALLKIEAEHGRTRALRWGPRTLDLDLLAWGPHVVKSATLTLPHPLIAERRFVLQPWCELAPDFILPGTAGSLSELLDRCPDPSTLWELEAEKAQQSPR